MLMLLEYRAVETASIQTKPTPSWLKNDPAVKIMLFSSVRVGRLRLTRSGFNRRPISSHPTNYLKIPA